MIRKILITAFAVVASVLAAAVPALAAPAAASTSANPTAPTVTTPEQAGYYATGARFRYARTTFRLPDAGNYASQVGSFGFSVQLWSADQVHVLGISTCGTDTCTLAGTTVHSEAWNAAVAVFDRNTHGIICDSNTGPWTSASCLASASTPMAAGDLVTESIFYNRDTGFLTYKVIDATAATSFTYSFHVTFQAFRAARISNEFASDPFSRAPYNAPDNATILGKFRNVHLTNYFGHRGTLTAPYWAKGKLIWTRNGLSTGAVNAVPHGLFNSGSAFNVFLQP